jgi:predicted nuclease of predicted toxin-antitoxin system
MKIVIDMNLSPLWCETLARHGHQAVHWSTIGECDADDMEIMRWAAAHGHIVFTHDLDFGALLAALQTDQPSVIQFRTGDIIPDHPGARVVALLEEYKSELENGALIVVEEGKNRIRILPLKR